MEEESKAVSQAALSVRDAEAQSHNELTQSMHYSPFASEGKAMKERRIHQEQ